MAGTTQYVVFGDSLLSLTMFLRLIHVVASTRTALLVAE